MTRISIKEKAEKIKVNTQFEGFLPKEQIMEVYKKCHFIVLPSKNEGFPKVIGEGMNYGCLPIGIQYHTCLHICNENCICCIFKQTSKFYFMLLNCSILCHGKVIGF